MKELPPLDSYIDSPTLTSLMRRHLARVDEVGMKISEAVELRKLLI
jgi:hypothetical protein